MKNLFRKIINRLLIYKTSSYQGTLLMSIKKEIDLRREEGEQR